MINLQKYIYNKTNEDIIHINNELELHFYAEYILNESFKYSYFIITEKYGSYIGQKDLIIELAKEIYNIVRNNEPTYWIKLDKNDIKGFDNIFFNTLYIDFTENTGYIPNKSKYIKSEKKFDLVYIELNIDIYHKYTDIARCIMHEILHAWNHYQSYNKDAQFNLQELTNKNSKYYKTLFDGDLTVTNICKRICNTLTKIEKNAYLNELTLELDINDFDIKQYSNVNDAYKGAYKIFTNSDVWQQYSVEWTYVQNLINEPNKVKSEFKDTYNYINNTSLSFNKIYKKLNEQFNNIFKKIETTIPKIFYDYYKEQMNKNIKEGLSRQNNELIELMHFINEYNSLEPVKPENNKEWEVYLNETLNDDFTDWAKFWKVYPKVGQGWYAGGKIFKIIKIEDNKIFTQEDDKS